MKLRILTTLAAIAAIGFISASTVQAEEPATAAKPATETAPTMMGNHMDMHKMSGMMHECHKDGKMCEADAMQACQKDMKPADCTKMMAEVKKSTKPVKK